MTDLIAQIEDPRLRERLGQEWAAATKEKKFGLVFDPHLPELLPLPGVRPRRGDLVAQRGGALTDLWRVRRIAGGVATCARPEGAAAGDLWEFPVDGLMVVRQFGEPIFPALVPLGSVQNGPADAPWHVLIEADNFHALQVLDYLYAGQVDCIYIDPPYNTGARDWKYNNDYVDGNDAWRHSKWLAFIERRLRLAKRLLKPDNGVLIVTIDRNELHHLGMLLNEILPDALIQLVTICINPSGTSGEGLSRVEEYAVFCFLGSAQPSLVDDDGLTPTGTHAGRLFPTGWESLLRRGNSWYRKARVNLCYPVILSKDEKTIIGVGSPMKYYGDDALDLLEERNRPLFQDGYPLAWPVRTDGRLGIWRIEGKKLEELRDKGYSYVSRRDEKRGTWSLKYLMEGAVRDIDEGRIEVLGRGNFGEPILRRVSRKKVVPKTIWCRGRHTAGASGGTGLLLDVLGRRDLFSFPKSIYAVRDCLDAAIGNRSNALVVDFFAGSGTTLNAINLMNALDNGSRRCILVTNNELSGDESETLTNRGHQPGDDAWEAQGICRAVTWPRSRFTILGRRDDGTPLPGDYLTGRTVERERPRRFVQIGFIDQVTLDTPAKKRQLVALIEGLPQTLVTDPCPFIVSENHAATILFEEAAAEDWLAALDGQDQVRDLYILTPVKRRFEALKAEATEILGPILFNEEERRPLAAGFPANLAWFRLDFLDQDRVALRRAFREILPLLWLKAGAIGPRPEWPSETPEPPFFAPAGNPFAVLLDEGRLPDLIESLMEAQAGRANLRMLFIVTDSQDSFRELTAEAEEALGRHHPELRTVQLYRDYLENFLINRETAGGQP